MLPNKHTTAYQYPFPAVPEKWTEEEKRFAAGLRDLFDQLFARRIIQDAEDGHKLTYAGRSVTIPDNDTTYSDATASTAGLMSAADKQKLDGVADGAEVNVNADWQATTGDAAILNKPDIPQAASSRPLMDGTAAVGTSAKYAREDHVHPSDTGKVNVEAGKGLSTNDYTTAEKEKLAGIAAGAEVNVNADWNAASGDARILNKPTALSNFTNDEGFTTASVIVDCGTLTSLPKTVTQSGVTADMTVDHFEMSNPAAFTGRLTIVTSAGSVTVSGTINGSSTLKLKLSHTA